MMENEKDKVEIAHIESNTPLQKTTTVEDIERLPTVLEHNLEIPDSLKHLSELELKKLETKTKLKVDIRILPCIVYIYIMNYLDRNNITNARLGGLEKDISLHGNQYETCISILFVGFFIWQIPSNMILSKLGKPSSFITGMMTAWGIVSTCTGAVQSYAGLVVVRFVLGWIEAGFLVSCLYYLSSWYTRKELALRNSILYSGSLISSAFSGLIAAGILSGMHNVHNLEGWRWLFIIEGAITVGSVPFAYFILPDMPHNTKFLSQQEKDLILWKLRREVGQDDSDLENIEGNWGALKLALKDLKIWFCAAILMFINAATGVTNYFPTLVKTLNFGTTETLCLTAPPYLLAVISTFIWSRHADKTGERTYHVCIPLVLSLAAFIIGASTLNVAGRYFSMCLMIPSLYCGFVVVITWLPNCVPRPPLKRAIAIPIMNCVANSAFIWTAYLYPSSDGPRYLTAFVCNCVFVVIALCFTILLRQRVRVLNRRIDLGTMDWEKELGKGNDGSKISPDFRYLY